MKPLLALAALAALAMVAALPGLGAGCGGEGVSPGVDADVVGATCGGRGGATCPASQYCDYGNNRCGGDDMTGVCRPRPASCPPLLVPERTCGCDGVVYPSLCDVMLAGSDLNGAGTCQVEAGSFACGYRQCTRATQYCERTASAFAELPDDFTCRGLPSGCGSTPSCACLTDQPCGDRCAGDAAAGLTLTCAGT